MYELKKMESKFVGTGPSFYKKRIYQAAVSQSLRNTGLRNDIYNSKLYWINWLVGLELRYQKLRIQKMPI
jgi:hypothetical protein